MSRRDAPSDQSVPKYISHRITPSEDELMRCQELLARLHWLMTLRWIAIGSVFIAVGLAYLFSIVLDPKPLYAVALVLALSNLGFHYRLQRLTHKSLKRCTVEAIFQLVTDLLCLTGLLYFAGGLANPFVFFFTFHVAIAGILLDRAHAYALAGLAGLLTVWLLLAEWHSFPWFSTLSGAWRSMPENRNGHLAIVFVSVTTHFLLVYFICTIMENLRRRNLEVRKLNAELADQVERLALAEQRLKAEHERAQSILECMDEAVLVVDLEGRTILANSKARASIAGTLDEILAQAGVKPTAHTNGVRILPPEAPVLVEQPLLKKIYENTVSTVRNGKGVAQGVVLVGRDATERRALEKQVLHAEKLHAVGSLAAGVAHELNTPLSTILGYAQMLLEDPQLEHSSQRDLRLIEGQTQRCRRIVKSLLEYARKSEGERVPVELHRLIESTIELTCHSLEMRAIRLEFNPVSAQELKVLADADELRQVLVNLITNAADAFEDLPEQLRAARTNRDFRVLIELAMESPDKVRIAIEDNGPGIAAELKSEIFEPFFTTKEAGKGTGLGLSIARRIIEDHDGSLRLCEEVIDGARFEVLLPLSKG